MLPVVFYLPPLSIFCKSLVSRLHAVCQRFALLPLLEAFSVSLFFCLVRYVSVSLISQSRLFCKSLVYSVSMLSVCLSLVSVFSCRNSSPFALLIPRLSYISAFPQLIF